VLFLEVDGGCRDTHSYIGIGVSASKNGQTVAQISRVLRGKSSTDAELLAIAHGMCLAIALGAKDAVIATDCRSCVDILNGRSMKAADELNMRANLLRIINEIRDLHRGFLLTWMGRDSITDAHELSTLAMERYRHLMGLPGVNQRPMSATNSSDPRGT